MCTHALCDILLSLACRCVSRPILHIWLNPHTTSHMTADSAKTNGETEKNIPTTNKVMYAHELHRVYISFKQMYTIFLLLLVGCAGAVLFRALCWSIRFNFHFIFVSAFFCFSALQSRSCAMSVAAFVASFFLRLSLIYSPSSHLVVSAMLTRCGLSHPFGTLKNSVSRCIHLNAFFSFSSSIVLIFTSFKRFFFHFFRFCL